MIKAETGIKEKYKTNKIFSIKHIKYLLVLVFIIKTMILAFFITPLWDIPDEPGHYAYIQDIVQGKGIPVLGKSFISEEIVRSWYTNSEKPPKVLNWIAQHPPGYYLLGAVALKTICFFTNDPYWLFRAPRIVSLLAAALALLVFFQIFFEVTKDETLSLIATACISFIPMFSHMASGTNHDTLLTLFAALAILYWLRFVREERIKDAYIMATWLSLAAIVKITALALAIPILVTSFFHFGGALRSRIVNCILVVFVSGFLQGLWMIRNWILFRNPLVDASILNNKVAVQPLNNSILEYITTQPVFQQTYKNFFGLIGWTGTGHGQVLLLQIDGAYIQIISLILTVLLGLSYLWFLKQSIKNIPGVLAKLTLVVSLFVMLFFFFEGFTRLPYSLLEKALFSFLLGNIVFCVILVSKKINNSDREIFYALFAIGVYLLFYLAKLTQGYNVAHKMVAVHGRYWFPTIPLLFIGFLYPAFKYIKIPVWLLVLGFITTAGIELLFFTSKVIPFYQGGSL